MEEKYKVYAHINKENGFVYIGITCNSLETRWLDGKGYATQSFFDAIIEYGWRNFNHVLLADGLSKDVATKVEAQLIKYYKKQNISYNVSDGIVAHPKDFSKIKLHILRNCTCCNKKVPRIEVSKFIENFGMEDYNLILKKVRRVSQQHAFDDLMVLLEHKDEVGKFKDCETKHDLVERYISIRLEGYKKQCAYSKGLQKKIILKNKKTGNILEFNSHKEATEELNVSGTTICDWLKGKCKSRKYIILYDNGKKIN